MLSESFIIGKIAVWKLGFKNQYVIYNGHHYPWIFYDFRYKWCESENWYYSELDPSKESQYIAETGTTVVIRIVVPFNGFYEVLGSSNSNQLDMQIRAINGYSNFTAPFIAPIPYVIDPSDYPVIVVNASDWSQIQTIDIPASNFLPTPSVPEFSWLIILPLFILILSFIVLIRNRKWINVNCYGNDKKRNDEFSYSSFSQSSQLQSQPQSSFSSSSKIIILTIPENHFSNQIAVSVLISPISI